MTRHDSVGKVTHRELWMKFKFEHSNIWYMHNPASVLEYETHKLLCDFDMQTDHLISARRSDKKRKEKRTYKIGDFTAPADHRVKLKENEKKDKYLDLARELKKKQTVEHETSVKDHQLTSMWKTLKG